MPSAPYSIFFSRRKKGPLGPRRPCHLWDAQQENGVPNTTSRSRCLPRYNLYKRRIEFIARTSGMSVIINT